MKEQTTDTQGNRDMGRTNPLIYVELSKQRTATTPPQMSSRICQEEFLLSTAAINSTVEPQSTVIIRL